MVAMKKDNRGLFKTRTWLVWMFLAGLFMLSAGIVGMSLLSPPAGGTFSSAFISMGAVLVVFSGLKLWRGEGDSLQDERTRKIGAYGLSWSWFLTFIVLFVVFWADYLGVWSPDAATLSVLLILLMGISARAFQMFLFRRGDVD
ncbi:MAG: hypothetical protein QHG97_03240 [Methanolinea sp.]|jgi:peptidoglycan/LPS O-acetylase OafA/YrhL|nr:hypothetical protein [Methanolinea sp.]